MISKLIHNKLLLVIIHIGLGFLFLNETLAFAFVHIIFIVGLMTILITRNKNNEALLWSIYLITFEVLFRATSALFLHEFVKYAIMAFLLFGIYAEQQKKKVPIIFIAYFFLLAIGILFSDVPANQSLRKAILFNLSGPISLGVAVIYTYHRIISKKTIIKLLQIATIPLITFITYLFLETPDFKDIVFNTAGNKYTSGGFGPNQVSTILGIGLFTIPVLFILKKRLSGWIIIDLVIFFYIFFRVLITFSRGGLITALLALIFFIITYSFSNKIALISSLKYLVIGAVLGFGVWVYSTDITGGMLANRYTNRNASGVKKDDITTGRGGLFNTELQYFYDNPVFGIGVGSTKYKRIDSGKAKSATHTEIGRLLSEHGSIGIIILFILLTYPLIHFFRVDGLNRAFLLSFYVFWFLTINHSAMRLAFPGFVYSLTFLTIRKDE